MAGVTVERLVVRAPNWLGDAVMALPALGAIRRHFTDAQVTIAARASIAPLFSAGTEARPDAILTVAGDSERDRLRDGKFDAILLLTNSFQSAWIARRARVPERWGYRANSRRWLLTRSAPRPRGRVHMTQSYLELARRLGIDAPDETPRVAVPAELRARGDAALARAGVAADASIVGFAPGAAYGRAKRWPPDRVAAVAARLAARGVVPLLLGAADDRDTGREIESCLPSGARVVNLIGRTDLGALIGVLARCRAFVSNDSGAMHLAAAAGVPVTAMFGPTDERVTAPIGRRVDLIHRDVFCRPCLLRECPIDHRCMKRIGVDDVVASVERMLNAE
jgi:heptosyltransferase II